MTSLQGNAYYDAVSNQIRIFAGLLQYPLFDPAIPTYLTYGGMGSIVGHELTHGFDTNGRFRDATGNLTQTWDNATIAQFTKRTECFVKQYDAFTVTAPNGTALHANGTFTLSENIADAGGITNSFAAWKKSTASSSEVAPRLPGLDAFTPEQLFFMKWGQNWCEITPLAVKVGLLSSDIHAPNAARASVALQNSAEFKKAFNCPIKEPTCELW